MNREKADALQVPPMPWQRVVAALGATPDRHGDCVFGLEGGHRLGLAYLNTGYAALHAVRIQIVFSGTLDWGLYIARRYPGTNFDLSSRVCSEFHGPTRRIPHEELDALVSAYWRKDTLNTTFFTPLRCKVLCDAYRWFPSLCFSDRGLEANYITSSLDVAEIRRVIKNLCYVHDTLSLHDWLQPIRTITPSETLNPSVAVGGEMPSSSFATRSLSAADYGGYVSVEDVNERQVIDVGEARASYCEECNAPLPVHDGAEVECVYCGFRQSSGVGSEPEFRKQRAYQLVRQRLESQVVLKERLIMMGQSPLLLIFSILLSTFLVMLPDLLRQTFAEGSIVSLILMILWLALVCILWLLHVKLLRAANKRLHAQLAQLQYSRPVFDGSNVLRAECPECGAPLIQPRGIRFVCTHCQTESLAPPEMVSAHLRRHYQHLVQKRRRYS